MMSGLTYTRSRRLDASIHAFHRIVLVCPMCQAMW